MILNPDGSPILPYRVYGNLTVSDVIQDNRFNFNKKSSNWIKTFVEISTSHKNQIQKININ